MWLVGSSRMRSPGCRSRNRTQPLLYLLVHRTNEFLVYGGFKIEVGKILAIISHAHARADGRTLGGSSRNRLKECRLADAVGTFQKKVLVFAQCHLFLFYA